MAEDINDNLTEEQEASIQAIADRVRKLNDEQKDELNARMEAEPDNTDFDAMLDELEAKWNTLTNEEGSCTSDSGNEGIVEGDSVIVEENENECTEHDESQSKEDTVTASDNNDVLGDTIAYAPVAISFGDSPITEDEGIAPDANKNQDMCDERSSETVSESEIKNEGMESGNEDKPIVIDEKDENPQDKDASSIYDVAKAQRRSRRSFRIACAIIGISLAVIIASVATIVIVFSSNHFVSASPVAIEDASFGISEDDLAMLAAEGYDGDELTDDAAEFMETFFTFDKASVEDGSWESSFEDLIAVDDLVQIKENLLYARLDTDWDDVFEIHPYYKSKWISNNSISWNILPTDTVNVPYCDVYATIECSPLEVYFLNSPSLEINRYINCYRIVFDADGKITSIKKLRTIQKEASVDKEAMENDKSNAEKAFELQRKKAEQIAKEKAAAEEAEKARQEAEEEAKRKAEEEKAKEEADKAAASDEKKNQNSNTGSGNTNTGNENTNTGGNENTNTGGNTNTGSNTGGEKPDPSPTVPPNTQNDGSVSA